MGTQHLFALVAMLLSGLAVALFSRWMIRLGDKTKAIADTTVADREILQALRPYIAERGLPDIEIIDALIASTARRHGRNAEELNSVRVICEDLMREILCNVYMPVGTKQEYTRRLSNYLRNGRLERQRPALATDIMQQMAREELIDRNFYRAKIIGFFGYILSFAALVATGVSSFAIIALYPTQLYLMAIASAVSAIVFGAAFSLTLLYAGGLPLARKNKLKAQDILNGAKAEEKLEQEASSGQGFQQIEQPQYSAPEPASASLSDSAFVSWDTANVDSIAPDSLGEDDFFEDSTLREIIKENYGGEQKPIAEEPEEKQEKPKKPRKKKAAKPEPIKEEDSEEPDNREIFTLNEPQPDTAEKADEEA